MPIYEYLCDSCGKKSTLLVGMIAEPDDEKCAECGSSTIRRLVSRFKRGRGEDERVDAIADRLESVGEPESAASMREMVKEMGKAMDEDLSDDLEEMFEGDMDGTEVEE